MLTWPSRKVWRTGSNITTGSTRARAHHRIVRRSSAAHTARRLTAISANTRGEVEPGERHLADPQREVRERREQEGGERRVGETEMVDG